MSSANLPAFVKHAALCDMLIHRDYQETCYGSCGISMPRLSPDGGHDTKLDSDWGIKDGLSGGVELSDIRIIVNFGRQPARFQ